MLACYTGTMSAAVTLAESFATISEPWRPVVVATANGQDVRLVKTRGLFPWHRHVDADEVFVCWRGVFRVEFRDRVVELRPGQLIVVPRGLEHRTGSDEECEVMIFEPSEVVNTGDAPTSEYTAPRTTSVAG
jgi:mannose-6-phosphate isomerase-like protein (cupin superfamily)